MTIEAALHESPQGLVLDVEVTASAASSLFPAGFNAWRRRIEARVAAEPEAGRANALLVELVADRLGVPTSAVEILSGHRSRQKRVLVRGLLRRDALERLGAP